MELTTKQVEVLRDVIKLHRGGYDIITFDLIRVNLYPVQLRSVLTTLVKRKLLYSRRDEHGTHYMLTEAGLAAFD